MSAQRGKPVPGKGDQAFLLRPFPRAFQGAVIVLHLRHARLIRLQVIDVGRVCEQLKSQQGGLPAGDLFDMVQFFLRHRLGMLPGQDAVSGKASQVFHHPVYAGQCVRVGGGFTVFHRDLRFPESGFLFYLPVMRYFAATTSISTSPPFGSPATSTQDRAGL